MLRRPVQELVLGDVSTGKERRDDHTIPDYKRKARTQLLEQRVEEYDAVNAQFAGELSAVNRKRLERQAEDLELEIEQLRRELGLAIEK